MGLLCVSPHRAVDQEVDGAVDGQEEVVDAEKYIRLLLVFGLATIEVNGFTMFFWSKTIGFSQFFVLATIGHNGFFNGFHW